MNVSEKRRNREGKILLCLNKLGVVDVDLIKRMNVDGLGDTSNRNVLRVLKGMEDKGLIKSMRKEKKLFCLKDRKFSHLDHRMLMNRFLVKNGFVNVARIEPKVVINGIEFRPDFMIPKMNDAKKASDWRYFEVDRTQKRKVNMEKVKRYKDLGLSFEVVCGADRVYMWKGYVYHVV